MHSVWNWKFQTTMKTFVASCSFTVNATQIKSGFPFKLDLSQIRLFGETKVFWSVNCVILFWILGLSNKTSYCNIQHIYKLFHSFSVARIIFVCVCVCVCEYRGLHDLVFVSPQHRVTFDPAGFYAVDGLKPDTLYMFSLAARSDKGLGVSTQPIEARTAQSSKYEIILLSHWFRLCGLYET